MKRNGFTLVELSIVLVIIGLLIGGILIGQSLIESAKIGKVIREVQQYDIAIRGFREKFQGLPGDHPQAGSMFGSVSSCTTGNEATGTCSGDGNGFIDFTGAETYSMWEHLALGGFLTGASYTGTAYTDCTFGAVCIKPGVGHPTTAFGDETAFYGFYRTIASGTGNWTGAALNKHVYWIIAPDNQISSANDGRFTGRGTSVSEAAAIDAKLDDGAPYTGNVNVPLGAAFTSGCVTLSRYNILTEGDVCITEIVAEFE